MLNHHLYRALRATFALAVVLGLLGPTFGPPALVVRAAEPAEAGARLEVVVKQVKIHDDRDLVGEGEQRLTVDIWRCPEGMAPPCLDHQQSGAIARLFETFGAGTGDTVTLERVVPQELGRFAIYPGRHHVVQFNMDDTDGAWSMEEEMGKVLHVVDTGDHGLGLGTHTARSRRADGVSAGDYTVTYEIRRAHLPDLRASQIEVHDLAGSTKKRVCAGVQNVDMADAGPFETAFRVDGNDPQGGRVIAVNMPSGEGRILCVEIELPDSGQHVLSATVDDRRRVIEFNETNNVVELKYEPTG